VYLRNLTAAELGKAHEVADYLLGLPVSLDQELASKLDTLCADLTAAIEHHQPTGYRSARTGAVGRRPTG
jgi:hypothetical protein